MARSKIEKREDRFTARFPEDLGRIASKGMSAMETFLDLGSDPEVPEEEFTRAATLAKVGCTAFGGALRFLQAKNNADAIALAVARHEGGAVKAIE